MFPAMSNISSTSPLNLSEPVAKNRQLVLVFSSDPDTLFLFKILLGMLDYQMIDVTEITDCVEVIKAVHPAMILLDVRFPFEEDISGLSELRENVFFAEIPILLISNYPREAFPQLTGPLNVRDHLTKPIDFNRLQDCLVKNIEKNIEKSINVYNGQSA